MKNTNKVVLLSILGILLIGSYSFMTLASAQEPVNTQVNQNRYQGSIAGNETHQFTFRNRFQFQLRTNATVDLDMDVDVDGVGDRNFQLELNTQENVQLQIRINASDENLGLTDGNRIQAKNQNRYQYQAQFRVNLTCNGSVNANLSINTNDPNAEWAYFDEENEEWITVESTYQDGVLTAETNHFSVWTVLTPEEDATSSIPGYTLIGLGLIGSIIALLIITKKKK